MEATTRVTSSAFLFLRDTFGTNIGNSTPSEMIVISTDRTKKKADGSSPTRNSTGVPNTAASVMESIDRVMFVLSLKSVCNLRAL